MAGLEAALAARPDLTADGFARTTSFAGGVVAALFDSQATGSSQAPPVRRPVAFEYSEGYKTRLEIHKYASYATLPLFVAQFAVGQKLYDGNGSDGTRTAHGILAGGTEPPHEAHGPRDPDGCRRRRLPRDRPDDPARGARGGLFTFQESGGTSKSTHRAVALTSMGIATVSYLMMLIH